MHRYSRRAFSFILFLVALSAQAGEPFQYPEAKFGKGELKIRNGLPVLTVAGSPEEIGTQIAELAGKPGRRLFSYPKEVLEAKLPGPAVKFLWPKLIQRGQGMVDLFPADYRTELDAMVKASGVDRELAVAGNTMFDLKNDIGSLFGCSTVVVESERSATGKPLFGRNLDYPTLGYVQEYSLVTVYRPQGKHAFAAIGFPGLIGCLSGINEAGLSLAVLEVMATKERPNFDPLGLPYAICYRRLLEECSTVDEAEKLLRSFKRATTSNLTICDKNGGAVFEVTPSIVVRRSPSKGVCCCTNHFCSPELSAATPLRMFSSQERFDTLERMRTREKIDVAEIHRQLHAVNQRGNTLQTMVFEPAEMRLHLAIGKTPSSALKLKVLNLREFMSENRP